MGVEARLPSFLPVVFLTPTGQRDDPHLSEPGFGPQAAGDLESVDGRHSEVEQDDFRLKLASKVEGRTSVVGDPHVLAVQLGQDPREAVRGVFIVIDDEDSSPSGLRQWRGRTRRAGGTATPR